MNSAGNRSGRPWMSNQRAGLSPINSKGASKGFRLKRKQKHCLRLSKVRVARGCGSEMRRTGYLESMLSFSSKQPRGSGWWLPYRKTDPVLPLGNLNFYEKSSNFLCLQQTFKISELHLPCKAPRRSCHLGLLSQRVTEVQEHRDFVFFPLCSQCSQQGLAHSGCSVHTC